MKFEVFTNPPPFSGTCLVLLGIKVITPRENPRRRSVGLQNEAPQAGASDFRVGVQKKSAKILTMEAKTVKTNKRTESGQKWLKSDVSCDYFEPL